jgi:hypothetical protein
MPLLQNLLGRRFGSLTVLSAAQNSRGGRTRWGCSCACGGKTVVASCHLVSGHTRSCGCLRRRARLCKNLIGQRFGRLVVLARAGSDKHGKAIWSCACDCGNEVVLSSNVLVRGKARSCGCLRSEMRRERNLTHGMSHTREYRIFQAAKSRCTNPNNPNFADYGGRGIEFRLSSVAALVAALGPCPAGHSLDRIDVNGPQEQANNRRNNRRRVRRADLAEILAYAKSMAAAGANAKSALP